MDFDTILREFCPFKCTKCSKTFARQILLREHQRTHPGSSFLCDWCKEPFTQDSSRRRHMRTVCVQRVIHAPLSTPKRRVITEKASSGDDIRWNNMATISSVQSISTVQYSVFSNRKSSPILLDTPSPPNSFPICRIVREESSNFNTLRTSERNNNNLESTNNSRGRSHTLQPRYNKSPKSPQKSRHRQTNPHNRKSSSLCISPIGLSKGRLVSSGSRRDSKKVVPSGSDKDIGLLVSSSSRNHNRQLVSPGSLNINRQLVSPGSLSHNTRLVPPQSSPSHNRRLVLPPSCSRNHTTGDSLITRSRGTVYPAAQPSGQEFEELVSMTETSKSVIKQLKPSITHLHAQSTKITAPENQRVTQSTSSGDSKVVSPQLSQFTQNRDIPVAIRSLSQPGPRLNRNSVKKSTRRPPAKSKSGSSTPTESSPRTTAKEVRIKREIPSRDIPFHSETYRRFQRMQPDIVKNEQTSETHCISSANPFSIPDSLGTIPISSSTTVKSTISGSSKKRSLNNLPQLESANHHPIIQLANSNSQLSTTQPQPFSLISADWNIVRVKREPITRHSSRVTQTANTETSNSHTTHGEAQQFSLISADRNIVRVKREPIMRFRTRSGRDIVMKTEPRPEQPSNSTPSVNRPERSKRKQAGTSNTSSRPKRARTIKREPASDVHESTSSQPRKSRTVTREPSGDSITQQPTQSSGLSSSNTISRTVNIEPVAQSSSMHPPNLEPSTSSQPSRQQQSPNTPATVKSEPDPSNSDYICARLGVQIFNREYLVCCDNLDPFPVEEHRELCARYLEKRNMKVTRTRDLRSGNFQNLPLRTRRMPARILSGYPELGQLISVGPEYDEQATRERQLVYLRVFEKYLSEGAPREHVAPWLNPAASTDLGEVVDLSHTVKSEVIDVDSVRPPTTKPRMKRERT
eukprot:102099_1